MNGSATPTTCACGCGRVLPEYTGRGRRRRWYSDAHRMRAARTRATTGTPVYAERSLAGPLPAPEERFLVAVLESRAICEELDAIAPSLHSSLSWRAVRVAAVLRAELDASCEGIR